MFDPTKILFGSPGSRGVEVEITLMFMCWIQLEDKKEDFKTDLETYLTVK